MFCLNWQLLLTFLLACVGEKCKETNKFVTNFVIDLVCVWFGDEMGWVSPVLGF